MWWWRWHIAANPAQSASTSPLPLLCIRIAQSTAPLATLGHTPFVCLQRTHRPPGPSPFAPVSGTGSPTDAPPPLALFWAA